MQKLSYMSPGASENMHVQLIWHQFAMKWEFHPGQDRWGEFTPERIFFQFFSFNTVKGLTRHRVEFNPGRSFSCKKALRILKFYFKLEVLISLRENCPYSELFWPAFFRIWTE